MVKLDLKLGGIITVLIAIALLQCAEASAIYPSSIDAGILSIKSGQVLSYSFNVTSYGKFPQNITFRAVTDYLAPYVSFEQESVSLNSTNDTAEFSVNLDASNIETGNHTLIIACDSNIPEPSVNSSYNSSLVGSITSSGTAVIAFQVPKKVSSEGGPGQGPGEGAGSNSGGGGVAPGPKKALEIIAPGAIKTASGSAVTVITMKNTGEVSLQNLTLQLSSSTPLKLDYEGDLGDIEPGGQKIALVKISDISLDPATLYINVSAQRKSWTNTSLVYRIAAELMPQEEAVSREAGRLIPAVFYVHNLGKVNSTNLTIVPVVPQDWEKSYALISLLAPGETLNRTIFIRAPDNSFGEYTIEVNSYEDNILLGTKYLNISISNRTRVSPLNIIQIPGEISAPINSEVNFTLLVQMSGLTDNNLLKARLENAEECIENYSYQEEPSNATPNAYNLLIILKTKNYPAVCNTSVIVWSGQDNYAHSTLIISTVSPERFPITPILSIIALAAIMLALFVIWRKKKNYLSGINRQAQNTDPLWPMPKHKPEQ